MGVEGNPLELARLHVFPGGVKGWRGPRLGDKGRRTTGASINFNFEQTRKEANAPPGCIFDTPRHRVKPRGRVIRAADQQISGRFPISFGYERQSPVHVHRRAYRIHFLPVSHEETGYLATDKISIDPLSLSSSSSSFSSPGWPRLTTPLPFLFFNPCVRCYGVSFTFFSFLGLERNFLLFRFWMDLVSLLIKFRVLNCK